MYVQRPRGIRQHDTCKPVCLEPGWAEGCRKLQRKIEKEMERQAIRLH